MTNIREFENELLTTPYLKFTTPKKNQSTYLREMRETNFGEKTRVLVVGGTGSLGRRIVSACLAEGHETYVLQRPEIGVDIEKVQLLLSFKRLGAHLVEGSFSDHQSLVSAVKQVDVVVSAMSGVHFRTHNIPVQLKLVEAIKEAGNVKVKGPTYIYL